MNKIFDLIADKFTLPPVDSEMDEGHIFQCKDCGRRFRKVASLRKHQKTKHNPTAAPKSKKPVTGESERICPFRCKDYKKSANPGANRYHYNFSSMCVPRFLLKSHSTLSKSHFFVTYLILFNSPCIRQKPFPCNIGDTKMISK